jgi:hypothetical protein
MQTQSLTTGIKNEVLTNKFLLQCIMDSPYGAEATILREDQIKEQVEKIGLVPVIEKELRTLVQAIDFKAKDEKEQQADNLIRMFYTMLIEGRLDEVEHAFKTQFPEYYL